MKPLSNKEKRTLREQMLKLYKIDLKDLIRKRTVYFYKDLNVFVLEKSPIAFIYDEKVYPTLQLLMLVEDFEIPYVIVDKGAVKFIINGADVFRPGITEIDESLRKDNAVIVVSEDKKLLSIGKALCSYEDVLKMEKGKVVKNLHYYGDKIFRLEKLLKEG